MSRYSHRGYKQRTSGYNRRRRKATGFKDRRINSKTAKIIAVSVAVMTIACAVWFFADNISSFMDSQKKVDPPPNSQSSTCDVPSQNAETLDIPSIHFAEGEFDSVDNSIFVSNGCGYALFRGIDTTARNYSAILNSISSSVSNNVNIYTAVIPTNTEIGLDGVVEGSYSQKDNLNTIRLYLSDKVKYVDLYETLSKHKDEYIFYRTDPCMTALGGYYAYCDIAETADVPQKEIYSIDKLSEKSGVIPDFKGEFIKKTVDKQKQPNGNPYLAQNLDSVLYYKLPVHYNCYAINKNDKVETDLFTTKNAESDPLGVFPAKDTPLLYIENIQENSGRKLLIVKDHCAESVIGYLVPHYAEVHVVDVSLYKGDLCRYVNEHQITDIMFINGIDDANNSLYCQRLRDLFVTGISI